MTKRLKSKSTPTSLESTRRRPVLAARQHQVQVNSVAIQRPQSQRVLNEQLLARYPLPKSGGTPTARQKPITTPQQGSTRKHQKQVVDPQAPGGTFSRAIHRLLGVDLLRNIDHRRRTDALHARRLRQVLADELAVLALHLHPRQVVQALLLQKQLHSGRATDACRLRDLRVRLNVDFHEVHAASELVHHGVKHRLQAAAGPALRRRVQDGQQSVAFMVQLAKRVLPFVFVERRVERVLALNQRRCLLLHGGYPRPRCPTDMRCVVRTYMKSEKAWTFLMYLT